MFESSKRIDYIAKYLNRYQQHIELLNSSALFDSAKIFELFALEVCSLWFHQKFQNLNTYQANYPYVDLLSEDGKLYVQVSTTSNVPNKIKDTLTKIQTSKKQEFQFIKNIKFFVLNNESISKVKDLIGDKQIGNIPFYKDKDLITSESIIQKAKDDLEFQQKLYTMLKKDIDNIKNIAKQLENTIELSQLEMNQINCLINNEYTIDRNHIIEEILKDNYKNISIIGEPGSGKSVLCKQLAEKHPLVLYARAEEFLKAKTLDEIWNLNIQDTLYYLCNKPILFFIDALEFIADCPKQSAILEMLYTTTLNYPNAKIITSCRSKDRTAFQRLLNSFSIYEYPIKDICATELQKLAEKYTKIKFLQENKYKFIINSPFYLNLILSNQDSIENWKNEYELRNLIWNNIICLGKDKKRYSLQSDQIHKTIQSIVFDRAKNFLYSVPIKNYNSDIVEALIQENILLKYEKDNSIRLKYDIYEDICFEQYFHESFTECRKNYSQFFNKIESLGKCVYRRFQIWIENKLSDMDNGTSFINEVIFANNIPEKWKKASIIALCKSNYCHTFFKENSYTLVETNIIKEFIKITNLYTFEIAPFSHYYNTLLLQPCGFARMELIQIIADKNLYKENQYNYKTILKLCADCIYQNLNNKELNISISSILIYYFHDLYDKYLDAPNLISIEEILNVLKAIYALPQVNQDWIQKLWTNLLSAWKKFTTIEEELAQKLIIDTLTCRHIALIDNMPEALCKLAEEFWTYKRKNTHTHFSFYERNNIEEQYKFYGLNEMAHRYQLKSYNTEPYTNNFFLRLLYSNFDFALNWIIDFLNHRVEDYISLNHKINKYEVYFIDSKKTTTYLGIPEMWLTAIDECWMPLLLGDMCYILKKYICEILQANISNKEKIKFANKIRNNIFMKSNNIILLSLIFTIGQLYQTLLPGYTLDLFTNINFIDYELEKLGQTIYNPLVEILKNQRLYNNGIPTIKKRYFIKQYTSCINYMQNCLVNYNDKIRNKALNILDFLYSIIPNNKEHAQDYLQIQKMDLRNASINIKDNIVELNPQLTGEANILFEEHEAKQKYDTIIKQKLDTLTKDMQHNSLYPLDKITAVVTYILENRDKCFNKHWFDNQLISLVTIALNYDNLDIPNREFYCQLLIQIIHNFCNPLNKSDFILGFYDYSFTLFKQLNHPISSYLKQEIKLLILELITTEPKKEFANYATKFLKSNTRLAMQFFYTIIKLAEDEMNHQLYNANWANKNKKEKNFYFKANRVPKLQGVDILLEKSKMQIYNSKKNQIIEEYLFSENQSFEILDFNIDDYDITTLCHIVNTGISCKNHTMQIIVKAILSEIIDILHGTAQLSNIIDFYTLGSLQEFLQQELIAQDTSDIIIDLMFKNIDWKKFNLQTTEFYLKILQWLIAYYFDSYNIPEQRGHCQKIIMHLEKEIELITNEEIKLEFYKILILAPISNLGNWSKSPTKYSYHDKDFLSTQFKKYGHFHLEYMIKAILQLKPNALLPKILQPMAECFDKAQQNDKVDFQNFIYQNFRNILSILIEAFYNFKDDIKESFELTNAFERLLQIMIDYNSPEAAVILDEFHVH